MSTSATFAGLPHNLPSTSASSFNAFPTNPNPQDAHLHATLERIDQLVNEDIEMQAPLSESSTYLVLDTNILIHHFDVITQFVDDAERQLLPVVVVIPGAVIYELDGQKNRDGLAWFARRASTWLLEKVKERKMIRGQANEETCRVSGNWKIRVKGEDFGSERMNDDLILDCCLYFRQGRRTFLCSADKNLCFDVESAKTGIPTVSPTRTWSSREIARGIFGQYGIDLNYFSAYRNSYKDPGSNPTPVPPPPTVNSDDMMIVDDDTFVPDVLQPSHALDLLHLQVIDHFTRLFVELVARVGGAELQNRGYDDGTAVSRYAPQWQRNGQHFTEWNAADLLEYLNAKKRVATTSPQVDVFLSRPYLNRGARRGQDWSHRDWNVALEGLKSIGEVWDEVSISESLRVLDGHVEGVFATKMRPTGI